MCIRKTMASLSANRLKHSGIVHCLTIQSETPTTGRQLQTRKTTTGAFAQLHIHNPGVSFPLYFLNASLFSSNSFIDILCS